VSVVREAARRGIADALPIFVPAIPFALVIGVSIVETGMSPAIGLGGFPIIYAGSAQLTLITLLGSASALGAVAAALTVNSRHLMYSAALAPAFQRQPRWFHWVGAFLMIDQMFALSVLRSGDDPDAFRSYYMAAGLTFFVTWNLTGVLALLAGPAVPAEWNLGFAIPVMFLGMAIMSTDTRPKVVAAAVAGLVTFLSAGLPNRSGLLLGSVVGVAAGVIVRRWRP
jgi:predicted branched-subunit amino acid permease